MKTFYLAALLAAAGLTACNSGTKQAEGDTASIVTDSVVAESVAETVTVDTAAIVDDAKKFLDGFLTVAKKDFNGENAWEAYKLVSDKYFTGDVAEKYAALLNEVRNKCKTMSKGVPYVPATEPHSPFFCCGTIDGTDCGLTVKKYNIVSTESSDGFETIDVKVKVNAEESCAGEDDSQRITSNVTYVLKKVGDEWRIDNILNKDFKGGSLRESISNKSAISPTPFL